MGYADGFYYGQGRIICDTSTFSVGDTIRVRSMTDSSKVWNQQVATVGTALVFTVPPYDYYKICTVQDIGGVATEVGGVYKTVDYGQTLLIDVIDKFSIRGAKSIVNAHQEDIYSVGDEIPVNISGTDYPFIVAHIRRYFAHDIVLVAKRTYGNSVFNSYGGRIFYSNSELKSYTDAIGTSMSASDLALITEVARSGHGMYGTTPYYDDYLAKVWCPTAKEVYGSYPDSSHYGSPTHESYQFDYFITAGNRVGYDSQGVATTYWTSDGITTTSDNQAYCIGADGGIYNSVCNQTRGVRPCFIISADS